MKSAAKTFAATLVTLGNNLSWVVARIPFDVEKTWPERNGLRVRGEVEGFAFRTALFSYGANAGHFLLVNRKMQAATKARAGTKVNIRLEPDLEERGTLVPAELAKAMKGERRLRAWFDKLTPGMRAYIANQVMEPKSDAARVRRAEMVAEWLLETMEGELETPPILKMAFQRQPQARAGWEAMTATQRRNHLLGIFHLKSVDARERRVEKLMEEALTVAEKKLGLAERRPIYRDPRDFWL
jgi:uncharacterized protein YdeI (YjbR/CyaY-like superfamily)